MAPKTFIDAARDETIRLLTLQIDLLREISADDTLLPAKDAADKRGVMDKNRAAEWIETLEGERGKVERLEMVIAVAGTVKAGKSTCINAIIGTEALPNRNLPMTALPTLIRHDEAQEEPCLTLNAKRHLEDLAERIADRLNQEDGDDVAEVLRSEYGAAVVGQLVNDLQNGKGIHLPGQASGIEGIFSVLQHINDLSRIGRHEAVQIELPLEAIDELHEMPSVSVRFRHLPKVNENQGSLALLDLPGFNEAQQSKYLKDLLFEQMHKATAIIIVIDYTQMNTQAAEELQDMVDQVSDLMKDRIFVIVNKFDMAKSRDMGEEELKTYVASSLMQNIVKPENVFPVSASRAYLANRTLATLDATGSLPCVDEAPWLEDFADEVFSRRTKHQIEDLDTVRAEAEGLWVDSQFDALLTEMLGLAHGRAAYFAIQAAVDKLSTFSNETKNFLHLRADSLTADVEKLRDAIESVAKDIEHIQASRDAFMESINKAVEDAEQGLQSVMEAQGKAVAEDLKKVFVKEKDNEITSISESMKNTKNYKTMPKILSAPGIRRREALEREMQNALRRAESSGTVEYTVLGEYKKQLNNIEKAIDDYVRCSAEAMEEQAAAVLEKVNDDVRATVEGKLICILEKAANVLGDAGIRVKLEIPHAEVAPTVSNVAFNISSAGRAERRTATKYRQKDGFFSRFLNRLNDDWGLEAYHSTSDVYVIDFDKLKKNIEKGTERVLNQSKKALTVDLRDRLESDSKKQFDAVSEYLGRYRQALLQGQEDQRREHDEVAAIVGRANAFCSDATRNAEDIGTLKGATSTLLAAQGEAIA